MVKQRARASLVLVSILSLAAALGLALDAASTTDDDALLTSALPPPQRVYLEKYDGDPSLGNVLVIVELSPEQKERKENEGKGGFVTFGKDQQIILRDDGRGGDEKAGDGLYTGIAFIDEKALQERAERDTEVLRAEGSKQRPVFNGRIMTHYTAQDPFEYDAFAAGKRVPFDPAVIALEPEDSGGPPPTPTGGTGTGGTTASVVAAGLPPPPGITLPVPTPSPGVTNLFQDRVLAIRNPAVVQDAARTWNPCTNTGISNGIWTFNHLVTQLANQPASGIDPGFMVERWLETWTSRAPDPVINSITVPDREQMTRIIDQWPRTTAGTLDLNRSPLRLLAILPRVDLRRTTGSSGGYGGGASGDPIDAGELRFVFGFVLPPTWDATGFTGVVPLSGGCRALPFTVIFEYGVPACNCFDVVGWAKRWKQLRFLDPTTAAYKDHLALLTERVVRANADRRKSNGSAINQIRTNEIALSTVWELREFQLTQQAFSLIEETTTADTPADPFNNTVTVRNWMLGMIQPNLTAANRFEDPVPLVSLFFSGNSFLGAHPQVPAPPVPATTPPNTFFWTAPGLTSLGVNGGMNAQNWARHRVSRATCNSCHRRETSTTFLHVSPTTPLPAAISGFLSGINNVPDPAEAGGNPLRHFDDLLRREQDLRAVADVDCFRFHPINKAHVKASLAASGILPDDLFEGLERVPLEQRPAVGVADMNRKPVSEVH